MPRRSESEVALGLAVLGLAALGFGVCCWRWLTCLAYVVVVRFVELNILVIIKTIYLYIYPNFVGY